MTLVNNIYITCTKWFHKKLIYHKLFMSLLFRGQASRPSSNAVTHLLSIINLKFVIYTIFSRKTRGSTFMTHGAEKRYVVYKLLHSNISLSII